MLRSENELTPPISPWPKYPFLPDRKRSGKKSGRPSPAVLLENEGIKMKMPRSFLRGILHPPDRCQRTSAIFTTRPSATDFTAASASASAISPSSPVGSALPVPAIAAMNVAISAA
jgi:hypothetical protein